MFREYRGVESPTIGARLYWFPISHPAQAVRRMLDLKGIDYELAVVVPGTQRIHLRLVGFRGGTVPALKLDGRRMQGSRKIARALEHLQSEPPLFPAAPHARARVEEAERWGEEELQVLPREILRRSGARLFPVYPGPVPRFLPRDWLASLARDVTRYRAPGPS